MTTATFPHIMSVTLLFYALNPGTLVLSFMIYVLEGIFFQNKSVSSILKTCCGFYPFIGDLHEGFGVLLSCFFVSRCCLYM